MNKLNILIWENSFTTWTFIFIPDWVVVLPQREELASRGRGGQVTLDVLLLTQ